MSNLEYVRYSVEGPSVHSAILEVIDSQWLSEATAERLRFYPRWKQWDQRVYHHFVVVGHDNFVEVIAESFQEEAIPRESSGDLVRLIDGA